MNFLIRLGVPKVAVTEWKKHFVTAIFSLPSHLRLK